MKKRILMSCLVGLFLISILGLVNSADEEVILKLSSDTNAHAEVWNGIGDYSEVINFTELFLGETIPTDPHTCRDDLEGGLNNTIVWLYQDTNSHASTNNKNNYNTQVCYGNLTCTNRTNCNADETEVLVLTGLTNAHVGVAGTAYSQKICCKVVEPTCGSCPDANTVDCGDPVYDGCGVECDTGTSCSSGEHCNSNDPGNWYCDTISGPEAVWKDNFGGTTYDEGDNETITISSDNIFNVGEFLVLSYSGGSSSTGVTITIYNHNDGPTTGINFYDESGQDVTSTMQTDSSGSLEVQWIPKSTDKSHFTDNEFVYFTVDEEGGNSEVSKNLNLTLVEEGSGTYQRCSDYSGTSEGECEAAASAISDLSLTEGGKDPSMCVDSYPQDGCGDYLVGCGCYWDETDDNTCYVNYSFQSTNCADDRLRFGGDCQLVNSNDDDDCTDGVLFYKLLSSWTFDSSKSYTLQDIQNNGFESNLFNQTGSDEYYYDPIMPSGIRKSQEECHDVQNTVPCLSQLKLTFFGWFGFIVSLLVILGVYYFTTKDN